MKTILIILCLLIYGCEKNPEKERRMKDILKWELDTIPKIPEL